MIHDTSKRPLYTERYSFPSALYLFDYVFFGTLFAIPRESLIQGRGVGVKLMRLLLMGGDGG